MKKWLKYLLAFTLLFVTSITLTLYFSNNKVNASFSEDPRLKDEEIIIIDNSKNNKVNNDLSSNTIKEQTITIDSEIKDKETIDISDDDNIISTEEEINLISDTNIVADVNTYTDKINGDRCYVSGNTKVIYHIIECENASNGNALCRYDKASGKTEQGTVLRKRLKNSLSYCSNNVSTNTYTDKINGDRCYVNGNTKVIYHITECQKLSNNNSLCKYNKVNGKEEQGTIARNKLKSEISYCTKSSVEDGSIIGATGFSATNNKKYLRSQASNNSQAITVLKAGEPFKILDTNADDTWWKVEYNGNIGYVENAYAMINLPDYIPSIQYYMMNAEKNIYTASGVKLSIYGKKLYKTGKVYNYRLERDEYIVPVVYSFAKKILIAQNIASKEGYGLKIYDAYRPKSVADETRDSLSELYYSNKTARNGMDYSYENGRRFTWGQGWFIAQNLSSHSLGSAIDVVLVDKKTGNELPAQSSIHDLSTASIKYYTPISGQTYVRSDLYSNKANQHTKDLDRIMLSTGMTNLASEWWHFQDNDAYRRIKSIEPYGLDFQPTYVVSSK